MCSWPARRWFVLADRFNNNSIIIIVAIIIIIIYMKVGVLPKTSK
jgi:hypothetical protein